MFRFGESLTALLEESAEKPEAEQENLEFNRYREMEKALERINQLSLDIFNFVNDEIFGLYFRESTYDKGIELNFYRDLIAKSAMEKFRHDFERTLSEKQFLLVRENIGNDSFEKEEFLTYQELWEKYEIDPQEIIKKYTDFIDEHLIGGINPYYDHTEEEKKNSKRNSNKDAWQKWGINTDKVEKWITKQTALKSAEINSQEKFAELFALDVSPEAAQKIFEKYLEIMEVADSVGNNLSGYFHKDDKMEASDILEIKSGLVQKASDVLSLFADRLSRQQFSPEELMVDLDKIKSDTLTFKSIFRAIIKEHPEMGVGYFKDLDFKISKGEELSEADKNALAAITEKNYPDLDERKIALAGLEKGLKNKRTVFEILRHKGEIVSFLRFDRIWDKEPPAPDSYFGSFNTNPDFQEASIGDAMIRECLNEEAELHTVEAHTFPDKKIASKYIEEAGFIIEDIELNYMDKGKTLFRIRRDDKMNQRYKFRGESKPEDKKFFETMAASGEVPEKGNPFLKISTDKISDTVTLEKIKSFMQKHGLVITRFFPDNKENPKYFVLAFEAKIPEPELDYYIV